MILRLLLCLVITFFISVVPSETSQNFDALNTNFDRKRPKCERIMAEHCTAIGYNETRSVYFKRFRAPINPIFVTKACPISTQVYWMSDERLKALAGHYRITFVLSQIE